MINIKIDTDEHGQIIIVVPDPEADNGASTSGKTRIVAKTGKPIPVHLSTGITVFVNCTVYRYKE